MQVQHLAPFFERFPEDGLALEQLSQVWVRTLFAELPDELDRAEPEGIQAILKTIMLLRDAGLIPFNLDWLVLLNPLLKRPDWLHEVWLLDYLKLLSAESELLPIANLMPLARHPNREIRYWVFSQDYRDIPIRIFSQLIVHNRDVNYLPMMLLGLEDSDAEIQFLAVKYLVDNPPETFSDTLLEILYRLLQGPSWKHRSWSLLALSQVPEIEIDELFDEHFEQATQPDEQAMILSAWFYYFIRRGSKKELRDDLALWLLRIEWALKSGVADLQLIAAHAVATLNLDQHEAALGVLFDSTDLLVKRAALEAISSLESRLFAPELWQSILTTDDMDYRIDAVEVLVKLHPEFSKKNLASLILTEPRLAGKLVDKLNALGWREIPNTWLEVAKSQSEQVIETKTAVEPKAPWLEI